MKIWRRCQLLNNSRYVLALDPSGNYKEGKGITGWCLFDIETNKIIKFGALKASDYSCQFRYWDAHINLIESFAGYKPDVVVEDYLLYSNRAENQINSRLETPQLLGIIKYEDYKRGIFTYIQTAQAVKTRWSDEILANKKYIHKEGRYYKINHVIVVDHIRDAVRHAVHYATYNTKYRKGGR